MLSSGWRGRSFRLENLTDFWHLHRRRLGFPTRNPTLLRFCPTSRIFSAAIHLRCVLTAALRARSVPLWGEVQGQLWYSPPDFAETFDADCKNVRSGDMRLYGHAATFLLRPYLLPSALWLQRSWKAHIDRRRRLLQEHRYQQQSLFCCAVATSLLR